MLETVRDTYGNTAATGYTINWFSDCAVGGSDAFLASPFFTTMKPIDLLTERGCKVDLLVRLCSITRPPILRQAMSRSNVRVRYYTDRDFHAKLYIIGDTALVGSANLTDAGLMTNREASVVLSKDRDAGFGDLLSLYEMFWTGAETLTSEIMLQYEAAYRLIGNPTEENEFQKTLEKFVPRAIVPSAKVGSDKVSKERAFLQKYHRKYDEALIPAFQEVGSVFGETGQRRPEFADQDLVIEIGRFLGWCRLVKAPGDQWAETPLAPPTQRRERIIEAIQEWVISTDTRAGDVYDADREVSRIERLREALASPESISSLTYDELFDALLGVHAFNDRLRHVSGGVAGLKRQFAENPLDRIKETLTYLVHGKGLSLERAYDCIQNERWKLVGFGEACVMETLGWMDPNRPPINGRTIKALRYLGFDVHD